MSRITKPSRGAVTSPSPWTMTHLFMYEVSKLLGPNKPSTEKPCECRRDERDEGKGRDIMTHFEGEGKKRKILVLLTCY